MSSAKEWKKGGVCGFRFVLTGTELHTPVKFIDEGVKNESLIPCIKGIITEKDGCGARER